MTPPKNQTKRDYQRSRTFMDQIRYWDNRCSRWLLRHYYFIFFEFILLLIFLFFFVKTLHVIDLSFQFSKTDTLTHLLVQQSQIQLIICILLLLNSFWMLFMFNGINRIRTVLKDISYQILRATRRKN